jgi:hypothetical protein
VSFDTNVLGGTYNSVKENFMETKFYVVSTEDVGPNAEPLNERVYIQTKPAVGNMSRQPIIDGWCGTTNDIAEYAHGVFDSLEEAQKFVKEKWKGFEGSEDDYDEMFFEEETIIEIYADNRTVWAVDDWLCESDHVFDIRKSPKDYTEEKLRELETQIEDEAKLEDVYLDGDVYEYLRAIRDEALVEA